MSPESFCPERYPTHGTLHAQFVRLRGKRFGPYIYIFWRERGRQRKHYVRPGDLEELKAQIVEARDARRRDRQIMVEMHQTWRSLTALVREVEGHG